MHHQLPSKSRSSSTPGYDIPPHGRSYQPTCKGWKRRRAMRWARQLLGLGISAVPVLAGWKWHADSLASSAPGDAALGMLAGSLLMLFGVMAALVVLLAPRRTDRLRRWLPTGKARQGSPAAEVLSWRVTRSRGRVTMACRDPRKDGTGYSDEQTARAWWRPGRVLRRLRAQMERTFLEYARAFEQPQDMPFPAGPVTYGVAPFDGDVPRVHTTVCAPFFVLANDEQMEAGWGTVPPGELRERPAGGSFELRTDSCSRGVVRGISLAVDAAPLPVYELAGPHANMWRERFKRLWSRAFSALLAGQITLDCIPLPGVFPIASLQVCGGASAQDGTMMVPRFESSHAEPLPPIEVRMPRSSAYHVFIDVPSRASWPAESDQKPDDPGTWVALTGMLTVLLEIQKVGPLETPPDTPAYPRSAPGE